MFNSYKRPAHRPATLVFAALWLAIGIAAIAAGTAHAANYKMVLCAANNGAGSFATATNTVSAQHPSGIFDFTNNCGPAPDPAGNNAFLRIAEHEAAGNAGEGAYGSISWTAPQSVAILAGGGYTREPNAFNEGWRGRFWAEGFDGSTNNILMQGTNTSNSGIFWAPTSTFASHLWPFGGYGSYKRFVFELTCFRPAGCDRANFNAVDANSMVLVLADTSPSQVHLTNTGAPLLSDQWVRGSQQLTYSFSEQGSGVRTEHVRIDGADRYAIDHASECNTGSSQQNQEFARVFAPCPQASGVGRSYSFDTASLADGTHTVEACAQDYAQWKGLDGTGSQSCERRAIRTDNTPPGAPVGLSVLSPNPARYLDRFGARFSLPANVGSPVRRVHYDVVNAAGEEVAPERTLAGTNPTEVPEIVGPKAAGDYRLRVWLEDEVGLTGPAASAPVPHDTTPPAAPQDVSVTPPGAGRGSQGFDVRWRDVQDAGSPIDAVHYRVLDGAGNAVVPVQAIEGTEPQAIADLDTPRERGGFTLQLWLSDAEGNVGAPVSAPLTYGCMRSDAGSGTAVSAALSPEGSPGAPLRQGEGTMLRGRLHDAGGGGVANAPLCVFSRVITDTGSDFLGVALTGADGGYGFAVPAGPSRELSVAYRSGHREITAREQIATRVLPAFGVRKKVVRNKGIAHFGGWIPGPHNDGVVVVLQVKRGNGWLAFHRYRTRGGGHFTVSYRFNRTTRPTLYEMRAQVREQGGYPYLQGTSAPLRLVVLPARHPKG